jgi:hypothetical protein
MMPELPNDDRPIWERITDLADALPENAIAGLPTDGASQLDHYVYGAPKRADVTCGAQGRMLLRNPDKTAANEQGTPE